METRTFLDKLPANAMSKTLVAKVKIISSKIKEVPVNSGKISVIIVEAEVLKALKGVEQKAAIKVEVALHSCSREPKVEKAQEYYLAGAIGNDGLFHGEWKNYELEAK